MKIIGHMPNAMTKVGDGLMSKWKDDLKNKVQPEKKRVPGSGIEGFYIHFLHGVKVIFVKKLNNIKTI